MGEDGISVVTENGSIKGGFIDGFTAINIDFDASSVKGDGTYIFNGVYSNGKKQYFLNGDVSKSTCYWTGSLWEFYDNEGGDPIVDTIGVDFPWDSTIWNGSTDSEPVVKNLALEMNQSPVELNKLTQLVDAVSLNSFDRCSGVFSSYSTLGAHPIYTGYNTYSKNLNPFSKTAEYTVSYSNDPKQISGCSWNYTSQITRNGRYYEVVENGNILGHGSPQNEGYPKARTFYNTVKSGAYARNYTIYTGYIDTAAMTLKRVSESKTSSQFNGTVNYNFGFSDNPINNNDANGVKIQEISVNDSIPTQLLNKYELFNNGEIVQPQENSTLGNRSLDIQFSLTRNHNFNSVKTYARTTANSYIPTGEDVFLNSLSYTYNPIQKKFSLNAGWTFQRDAVTNI
jgi:hypothetical protein